MSSPITIAFAGAERSDFGVGPPAVPSRIRRERLRMDLFANARVLKVAIATMERPAACNSRRRERLKQRGDGMAGSGPSRDRGHRNLSSSFKIEEESNDLFHRSKSHWLPGSSPMNGPAPEWRVR